MTRHSLLAFLSLAAPVLAQPGPPASPPESPAAPGPARFVPRSTDPHRQPTPDAAASPHAAGGVSLRPRFVAGQSERYVLTLDTTSTTTGGAAGDTEAEIQQLLTLRLTVVSADPERGSVVRLTHERFRVGYSSHGLVAFADTDPAAKPPPAPKNADALDRHVQSQLAAGLAELVGATMTVHLDDRGRITSIEDDGRFAAASLPRTLGIVPATADSSTVAALFGPVADAGTGSGSPPARVTQGQKWRTLSTLSHLTLGDIAIGTDHRVVSIKGGLATVAFNTRVVAPSPGEPTPAARRRAVKVESFAATGTSTWDSAAGRLDSATAEVSLTASGDANPAIPRIQSRGLLRIGRFDAPMVPSDRAPRAPAAPATPPATTPVPSPPRNR